MGQKIKREINNVEVDGSYIVNLRFHQNIALRV